jgi:hypothetical protein
MAISTRSDLLTAIGEWMFAQGASLAGQYDTFIQNVEARLNHGSGPPYPSPALRVRQMETTDTPTIDADGVAALPDDFLEWRGLTTDYGATYPVSAYTPGGLNYTYPVSYGGVGAGFSVSGENLTFRPIPTAGVSLSYYAKIPALTEDNDTNWLLSTYPNVYLYGCTFEAAVFNGDPATASERFGLFTGALSGLVGSDKGARWGTGRARVMGPTP